MFNFEALNKVFEKKKVEQEDVKQHNQAGVIYILQCIYDNRRADAIDFTRFSIDDIVSAMECLESGYNNEDDCYTFDDDHEYGMAHNYSDFEYYVSKMFDDVASQRRRNSRKFV
ncbi:hypothetical protein D7X33_20190 [Butyricicoccus sp. 1XD8-22]|nr:hypothetical protein D7X33_20190 [Butyricicoccus sp. 1XD8-22]